ncbi:MAG: sulfite exporter TauE/SafE family protein [Deltaproteobacteria bacterium]|nr:sulfite exporter TauE/SafE family protein [Deltaproteobacteria bacterium]MBI3391239.1 sulfite exporter TauE/SafE family protein [Deltaproteobacteria bacterium]
MHSAVAEGVAVFAAAFVAGMINSVAGGGTLITFPTLVWLGRDPIIANVTSTVALWPGSLGGMLGFRRELGDSRRWMLLLAGPSIAGGLLGAFLLLRTPSRTFAAIVPYLILFATILFAVQEPLARWLRRNEEAPGGQRDDWWLGIAAFQFLVAVYGGYFGAGIGILMLAALGLLGLSDIHQMNGLKNFCAVCINLVAAGYFMLWGPVNWLDAMVMGAGAITGGFGGAGLARRLGREFVRHVVVVIGFAMAISLFLRG